MGRDQVKGASEKGMEEGKKIAAKLSLRNGDKIGAELGLAESKYWGLVRGEIQGYNEGHELGINSTSDIQLGTQEGKRSGASAAEAFAQANLKPQFFEKYLVQELANARNMDKAMRRFNYGPDAEEIFEIEKVKASIPDLTQEEIEAALSIKTSLDALNVEAKKILKSVSEKAVSMSRSDLAFEAPTAIPYGTVDCAKVYKAIQVFKENCAAAYSEKFKDVYVDSSYSAFSEKYPDSYKDILGKVEIAQREKQFLADFKSAYDVAGPEGLKVGKKKAYDAAFAKNYKLSYDSELPLATTRADNQANAELQDFKKTNALVTSKGASMPQNSLRGGDSFDLNLKLKNIGDKASTSPLLVEITEAKNVDLTQREIVLPAIAANATELKKALTLKVSSAVRSGEKILLKRKIHLP